MAPGKLIGKLHRKLVSGLGLAVTVVSLCQALPLKGGEGAPWGLGLFSSTLFPVSVKGSLVHLDNNPLIEARESSWTHPSLYSTWDPSLNSVGSPSSLSLRPAGLHLCCYLFVRSVLPPLRRPCTALSLPVLQPPCLSCHPRGTARPSLTTQSESDPASRSLPCHIIAL